MGYAEQRLDHDGYSVTKVAGSNSSYHARAAKLLSTSIYC